VWNFASYYQARRDYDQEAVVYEHAANKPHSPSVRAVYFIDAGIAYSEAGKFAEAEAALRAGIAAMPENPAGYEQLVLRVFRPERNLEAARMTIAQGIALGADPVKLYLAFAASAQASGFIDEAEQAAQKALLLRPSNFDALMRIGILDLNNNRFERAAMWLQKAVQINPSSVEAFYDLGLATENSYDYFAADRAYRRAISLAPADPSIKAHYSAFRQKLAQSRRGTLSP
jgi:Flp pilus assembly protein TadD